MFCTVRLQFTNGKLVGTTFLQNNIDITMIADQDLSQVYMKNCVLKQNHAIFPYPIFHFDVSEYILSCFYAKLILLRLNSQRVLRCN